MKQKPILRLVVGLLMAGVLWSGCRSSSRAGYYSRGPVDGSIGWLQPGSLPGVVQAYRRGDRDGDEARDKESPAWCNIGLNDEIWIVEKSDGKRAGSADRPGQGELRAVVKEKHIPLPLKHTDVSASIAGFISTVEVKQQYENPYDTKIEAVYVFPLPESSAVTDFVMTIGARKIRGFVREREEAEKIYKEAKEQGYRAALLTQERPNVFTEKVANIEPGARIDVAITYFNPLQYHDGEYEFVFPMVVGPRFNPAGSTKGIGAVGRGRSGISGQGTEVQCLRPDERSGHDISLTVELDAGVQLEKIHSPSHAIDVRHAGDSGAVVSLARTGTVPNKDFVLRYSVAGDRMKTTLMLDNGKSGKVFALMLQPPVRLICAPRMPQELVFVLDCSGSMSGAPITKVKQAAKRALARLDENDTFQIIRFSSSASTFGKDPVPATKRNIERAVRYVDELQGEGGTMAIEGVKAALDFPHDSRRMRVVSFMTDGYIGNEDEILAAIKQKLGPSRIFSFGIGSSVNRYFIEGMASFGKGAVAYVGLDESAGEKVDQFYERISHPALTDISIDWGGLKVADVYPRVIPDVYVGRPVMVVGKIEGQGRHTITIKGRNGGGTHFSECEVDVSDRAAEHPGITSIWARWRLKDLSEQEIAKPSSRLKSDIVKTSIAYNLISRYTAFIAVDSLEKSGGSQASTVNVAVPVPDGVKYGTTVQE